MERLLLLVILVAFSSCASALDEDNIGNEPSEKEEIAYSKIPRLEPQIIAHGTAQFDGAPANSLSNFYNAVNNHGFKFVECDTNITLDGVLVVTHWYKSQTLYDRDDNPVIVDIADSKWSDINGLFLTKSTHRYPHEPIVRVEDLMDLCKMLNVHLQIDQQGARNDDAYVAAVNYAIELGFNDQLWLSGKRGFYKLKVNYISTISKFSQIKEMVEKYDYKGISLIINAPASLSEDEIQEWALECKKYGAYLKMYGSAYSEKLVNKWLTNGADFIIANQNYFYKE